MEALGNYNHEHLMGSSFSYPHSQLYYISTEYVQESSSNDHVQSSSSFMVPKIQSYSSLNPQAIGLKFNSEGFPIRHEIIKKEPEDYIEDDGTDLQDSIADAAEDSTLSNPAEDSTLGNHAEDSTLSNPAEDSTLSNPAEDSTLSNPAEDIPEAEDDPPSPRQLRPRLSRQKAEVLISLNATNEDSALTDPSQNSANAQKGLRLSKILRDALKNPHSTCLEDRYSCRYCARKFPYPSYVLAHEESHTREPKHSCPTCGEGFGWPHSLAKHMKSHEPDPGFPCRYPGCPQTFQSSFKRWSHHKTHPRDWWNEHRRRPRQLRKNQKSKTAPAGIMPARKLSTDNKSKANQPMIDQIDKSKNAQEDSARHSVKSRDPTEMQEAPYPQKLQPRLTRQNAKVLIDSVDSGEDSAVTNPSQNVPKLEQGRYLRKILRNSIKNPHSTCTDDRHLCRYCPRTFAYPCSVYAHEGTHAREPKYLCSTCGTRFRWSGSLKQHMKSHDAGFPCSYPGCPRTFKSVYKRWMHHKTHPGGRWRERGRWPRALKKDLESSMAPATIVPKSENFTGNKSIKPKTEHSIQDSSRTDIKDEACKNAQATCSADLMRSHDSTQIFQCCYPGCPKTFTTYVKRRIHHRTHPEGQWNVAGRRSGYNLRQNRNGSKMPPKITSESESFTDDESVETSSMPDLSTEGPTTRSEIKSANNPEFDNIRQSAAINGAILLESRDSNILRTSRKRGPPSPKSTKKPELENVQQSAASNVKDELKETNIAAVTRRGRGRPAQPGDELEITTASVRKFKCDLCDTMFVTQRNARDHRLLHFDKPQIPCYMTGCTQMFFSRSQRSRHVNSVHRVRFRKGRAFLGSKRLALKITGSKKDIKKETIPNVCTAQQPSQPAQKIELIKISKKSQAAEELEEICAPPDNSLGSVQSTSEGDELPVEVKEIEVTPNPLKNLDAITMQEGPNPRYPIVKMGGMKYFYCGFPGCDAVFTNRNSRYAHHKKLHNDAYRSLLTTLADRVLPEKKVNQSSSTQPEANSGDEQKKATDMDSRPDFPFVEVHGKKYFWCDFPGCAIVNTTLEARYLHFKKHQMISTETTTTVAQRSVVLDPKKGKVPEKEPMQLEVKRAQIAQRNKNKSLSHTLPPNQSEISESSMPNDEEIPAQSCMQDAGSTSAQAPMQVLAVVLDQDYEADEQEVSSDSHNQSMDTIQFIDTDDDNPMEHISLLHGDFNGKNIVQTDGGLGNKLSTEASDSASISAIRKIPIPTSTKKDKVMQLPPLVKERKSKGNSAMYPAIQIGPRKLLCCDFPGCKGVFHSRCTRYKHWKMHRMGRKVNCKLKLTEDGRVLDSAEGSYLTE